VDQYSLDLCKRLTETHGAPGMEGPVAAMFRDETKGYGPLSTDKLGSVICCKEGAGPDQPAVMLPGHMDEIAFIVRMVDDEGYLKFLPLGGWFDQVLLSQHVLVHTRNGALPGVIGSKPPHIIKPEERDKVVKKEDMFIDIGAKGRKEAEKKFGVRVGDVVTCVFPFTRMANPRMLMAKAWDDRVGVALAIDALRKLAGAKHPNRVYAVGTVQEEVGCRGAQTAAYTINPDVALVLDVGVATDVPGCGRAYGEGTLGKGPQLCVLDGGMIPNRRLLDLAVAVAQKQKIPVQFSILERGATDGARIHMQFAGVPCVYIGVATRYIHSQAGIIHSDDYDHALKLIVAMVQKLDARTVKGLIREGGKARSRA
jgi:putative aminopeptidase FrvX